MSVALGPNEYGETAQLYHREGNHLDGPDGTLADVLEDLAEGLETGRYSLSDEELEAGEARPPLPPAPPLDPAVSEPSLADLRRELRSPETSPARLLELVQLSPELGRLVAQRSGPPELLAALGRSPAASVRAHLAGNSAAPPKTLAALAASESHPALLRNPLPQSGPA